MEFLRTLGEIASWAGPVVIVALLSIIVWRDTHALDPYSGAVTLGMIVVAPGLMVIAIIYFMGTVSGAHLNPAVTLAFAARGNFPWGRVPGYVLAQMIGAIAAALFLRVMFGTVGALGTTVPGHGKPTTTGTVAAEGTLNDDDSTRTGDYPRTTAKRRQELESIRKQLAK